MQWKSSAEKHNVENHILGQSMARKGIDYWLVLIHWSGFLIFKKKLEQIFAIIWIAMFVNFNLATHFFLFIGLQISNSKTLVGWQK